MFLGALLEGAKPRLHPTSAALGGALSTGLGGAPWASRSATFRFAFHSSQRFHLNALPENLRNCASSQSAPGGSGIHGAPWVSIGLRGALSGCPGSVAPAPLGSFQGLVRPSFGTHRPRPWIAAAAAARAVHAPRWGRCPSQRLPPPHTPQRRPYSGLPSVSASLSACPALGQGQGLTPPSSPQPARGVFSPTSRPT